MNYFRILRNSEVSPEEAVLLSKGDGVIADRDFAAIYDAENNDIFRLTNGTVLWCKYESQSDGHTSYFFPEGGPVTRFEVPPRNLREIVKYACLFENEIVAKQMLQYLKEVDDEGHHPLFTYFEEDKDFEQRVPSYISQLPRLLEIPQTALDFSEACLQAISQGILRVGHERCEETQLFTCLIAYLGEYLIRKINGYWSMELADPRHWRKGHASPKIMWVPYIRDEMNRPYALWMELQEALQLNNPAPLDWVDTILELHRFNNAMSDAMSTLDDRWTEYLNQ